MTVMMWVWLGIMVGALILELATMELVSIWFTFGAVLPFILETATVLGFEWQIAIFIIVSIILLLSLRKITKKYLLRHSEGKTNLETIIGKQCKLIEPITTDASGTIKINGVVWTAIAENEQTIESGAKVEIVKVDGNKIVVKAISEQKTNEA